MKQIQPASNSILAIELRLAANQRRRQEFPRQPANLARLVKLLHKLFNDSANALLREHGLTHPEYSVLIMLDGSEEGLSPGELAEATCEKAANTTRLVDLLIAKGLVTRKDSEYDRRRLVVCLTPAGDALIEQVLPSVSAQLQGFLRELEGGECDQLNQLLCKVISGAEASLL